MAVNDANKTIDILRKCCRRVVYSMLDSGLQPGAEDWVRSESGIAQLLQIIKGTWIERYYGDPSEWPWATSYVLHEFIRERKKTRKDKDSYSKELEAEDMLTPDFVGWVYFIADDCGSVKIGWTSRPLDKRLKEHQCGSGQPLRYLAYFDGTEQQERCLHVRFAEYRKMDAGTEWFYLTGELRQYIEKEKWLLSNNS